MLGALPLIIATGPGSELRRPLGMTIIGGLAGVADPDALHDAGDLSAARPAAPPARRAAVQSCARRSVPARAGARDAVAATTHISPASWPGLSRPSTIMGSLCVNSSRSPGTSPGDDVRDVAAVCCAKRALLEYLVEPPLDARRFLLDVVVVHRQDLQARQRRRAGRRRDVAARREAAVGREHLLHLVADA